MNLQQLFDQGISQFQKDRLPSPHLQVENIITHVLRYYRGDSISSPEKFSLTTQEISRIQELFDSRKERSPESYFQDPVLFSGLRFRCSPKACIPRSDTEILVDLAIMKLRGAQPGLIYDVGTGVGSIAISLATKLPEFHVIGTDITMGALFLAGMNQKEQKKELSIEWKLNPLLDNMPEKAEAIIANLPYVESENLQCNSNEVSAEPRSALDGGKDGLQLLKKLIVQASSLTNRLFLEVGTLHSETVSNLMKKAGFQSTQIHKDFLGRNRFVLGFKLNN